MRKTMGCLSGDLVDGFIRPARLAEQLGVSRSTVWRMEKAGVLPPKVAITGGRAVGWRVSEVIEFVNSRKKGRSYVEAD